MKKCDYVPCQNMTENHFCDHTTKLLLDDRNKTVACWNCGSVVAIFRKPGKDSTKYSFSLGCRTCSKKEEEIMYVA